MNSEKFEIWLMDIRKENTVQNRLSNCKKVEKYEGDLDLHYEKDKGFSLLERLTYSTEDQELDRPQKHIIPINGDIKNGTSTLKNSVNLYMKFKVSNDSKVSINKYIVDVLSNGSKKSIIEIVNEITLKKLEEIEPVKKADFENAEFLDKFKMFNSIIKKNVDTSVAKGSSKSNFY